MKKILFMSIALAAVGFASCAKDSKNSESDATKKMTIRLEGVLLQNSRMIEAPGQTGKLVLNDGYIYVINSAGSIVQSVKLDVAAATSATGQQLATPVSSDSRVYILGNIPSTITPTSFTTWEQMEATVVSISTAGQTDYTKAMLANSDGQPKMVSTTSATTATVDIQLSPLYSRLELAEVEGGANVVSFTVTGVFVDRYYSSFTLAGKSSGPVWNQASKTDFTGNIGDSGSWASTGAVGSAVAVPGTGQSWVYHMAADDLPRFIVRLERVVYNDANGQPQTLQGVQYITVTGYSGTAPAKFERGKIYQVAAVTLDPSKTSLVPNPTNVVMTVTAKVVDWVPTALTPTI